MGEVFKKEDIDWSNPQSKISTNFSVREATLLPRWGVYHQTSDQERDNILIAAAMMEWIREFLNEKPVNVNCWIRPLVANCPGSQWNGKNYNAVVGGAPASAHAVGLAVDFTISTMTCDDVRYLLKPELAAQQIRMEDVPAGSPWVHCDKRMPVIPGHWFFKP